MRRLITLASLVFLCQFMFGQLSGTKSIPGDYADIASAVTALNAVGVGSGGVTFNVAAGHTESITAPISLTATGTGSDPIIFQKSGAGANPLITANVGTNTPSAAIQDGIWNFVGSDYVTIDGIDLYDPNSTNPATMEYGYAMFKASDANGCQYNTIVNCVITLSRVNNDSGGGPSAEGSKAINLINALVTTQTTAVTPTTASGTNSNNRFYSNVLQNCNYGIVLYGYAATTPFTLGDTGNDVGGTDPSTGNQILNYGGATSALNPAAAVRANNQWGVNISYNTINNNNGSGVNHVSTLRGIYAQAGTSANANITFNNLTIKGGGTTSQVAFIENAIGSTAASNTVNINNNELTGDYLTATSGVFYGIYNTASAANVNINDNVINGLTYSASGLTGSGALYPIYSSGSATNITANYNTIDNIARTGTTGGTTIGIYTSSGTNQTVSNNSISSMSIDGTGASCTMYGIQSAGTTVAVNNNTVSMLTCIKTTGTGAMYGIYNGASPTNENFNYNTVSGLTHNGTGIVYGIYAWTAAGTRTMSYNTVYGISGAGTTIAGIYNYLSSPNVFNNKVYNIQSTSTGAPTVSGLLLYSLSTAGIANIYNNLIGDIKAPSASSSGPTSPSVRGINITTTTSSSSVNVSFNTIFLNAISTGTNFSTCGLFATTSTTATTAALTLKDNIIDNESTPAGTGLTVAYQRSSTSLTNYTSSSNNNLLYAGTPDATHVIFYDGTTSYQTIGTFKTLVAPRESASFSEDPNYVSTVGSNTNYLHINTSISTQIESGGIPVTGITTDYDGDTRNVSTPDIGADEFTGVPLDLTPPNFTLSPLPNTSGTGSRTLSVTITDASGVPTAGIGLPVLYWYINAVSQTPVQASYISGSQYDFTFGSGVVTGDVVTYYIVAQDVVVPVPNIGSSPSAGAAGFTYDPPACSTPPTTPYSYTIIGTLSGTYSVGVGQTYTTLTAAITDLNAKEVIAPVTFELWDATYSASETFPIIIYPNPGSSPTNTVTIKPKSGVTSTVTGAPATGIIVLYGADYVIIDGSNSGGSDKSLTLENTNTVALAYAIGVFNLSGNPASNCTIKNCLIKASSQVTNSTYAIILNASGGGYNNIIIDHNSIFSARYGIQFVGVSGSPATNGQITNNIIGSTSDASAIQYRGIVLNYVDNTLIKGNEIMGAPSGNTNYYQAGIYIMAASTNTTIRENTIHDFYYTGTTGYGCYGIYFGSDATTPTLIYNNCIHNIKGDGDPALQNYNPTGIYIYSGGNCKVYYNSINMVGSTLSSTDLSYSSCLSIYSGITLLDIRDNIFKNSMQPVSGTGNKTYAVYCASANTAFTFINYNDYQVDGINPNTGYLGGIQANLTAWQTATGQDANSIAADPSFVSNTNLQPNTGSPVLAAGTPISGITTDILSVTRSVSNPSMGAYENGLFVGCPAPTSQSISNKTDIGADLAWTDAGGTYWDLYIVPGGDPIPVAGTTPTVNDVIASQNPYTWAGGTSNTTYDWYVRRDCGQDNTDVSLWIGPNTFTTELVSPIPYEEGFLTTSTPTGWSITGWTIGSTRGVTGNPGNNIYKNLWSSAATGTFTTVNIGPVIGAMELTFDFKLANYSSPYDPPALGSGNYVISISTDYGATYTVIETVTNDGTAGWQSKLYDLSSYPGENIKIKIVGNWISGDYDLAFDNFKVQETVACPAPTDLFTSNITTSSATLNWSGPPIDSFFDVFFGPGSDPFDGQVVSGVSSPYSVSDLEPNTPYGYYVRTDCGFETPKVDNFWMAMDAPGNLVPPLSGGTFDETGEDGVWWLYDQAPGGFDWWNIWFYNDPVDTSRMKKIRMGFWIQSLNGADPGMLSYVINWSDTAWDGPGFPTATDEAFIHRSPVNGPGIIVPGPAQWIELYFIIPDYNPEWVSIDIWGENILIEQIPLSPPPGSPLLAWWNPLMTGGLIVHECLPKTSMSLWSGPVTFTTGQLPAAVPFTETFETWPDNWTVVNGAQPNKWEVGTATAHNGTQSAYISDDGGVTNAYNIDAPSIVHIYRDISFTGGLGGYTLKFWWKGQGEGVDPTFWDYLKAYVVDPTTSPTSGTELLAGQVGLTYNLQGAWTEVSIDLSGTLTGSSKRVVFSWVNDDNTGLQPPVAIDDVSIGYTPYTWTGSVDSDWNNPGNWDKGLVPDATIKVIIPADPVSNPDIFPVISAAQVVSCYNMTVGTGASIIVQPGGTLNILNP